ncbi:MAG: hypothetical protein C0504_00360 [Candidatus Solibacter sp.]|nr:hypothetical protein [Candidatus Solibacter sp.]
MWRNWTLLLVLSATSWAQEAQLEGVTVDLDTGHPLAGVQVRVFSIPDGTESRAYGAVSDREGRFLIGRMQAGTYVCLGEKPGYVAMRKNSSAVPNVIVKAGEHKTDLKLELMPRSTISGRVLDEYGDPMQNINVQVRPVSAEASTALLLAGESTSTDDRGEYRLLVGPGRFRVQATFNGMTRSETRTDGTAPITYTPTFYPGTPVADRATPVEVAAGADVRGIDIRMSAAAAGPGSGGPAVDGIVTGLPEGVPTASVYLEFAEPGQGARSIQSGTNSKFRFAIPFSPRGAYKLFARAYENGRLLKSQTVEFSESAPPSGVELRLTAGFEVTGTLTGVGGKHAIRLQGSESLSGDADVEGAFKLTGVFPGKYQLLVESLPENGYVKSVEVDGAAFASDAVTLARPARLKATVATDGGQISGSVLGADGDKQANNLAMVIISDAKGEFTSTDERHSARASSDGTYTLRGVAPGKYKLLGLDLLRLGSGDSELLKKLSVLAEEVEVKANDRLRKDIRAVSREDLDAKK